MKVLLGHKYNDLINMDNLLEAWQEFLKGKKNKKDVQEFQFNLMDNILALHNDLINGNYRHGGYKEFKIHDPKPRIINKATVRDRLLHHAVYIISYPFFDKTFIADSFSCRKNKGTHNAIKRFKIFSNIASKNNTKTCWVLKCDIKKFFASIDQAVLISILQEYIPDKRIINLLKEIISSFNSGVPGKGLPLGNLTSQLFCNIYMNRFDQFVKHRLKAKCYIRYADDFVVLHEDKKYLEGVLSGMQEFLSTRLSLTMHPDKISIKTLNSGVDFLGWVNSPHHRTLRSKTKNKMFKKLEKHYTLETLSSYLGLLKHGNTHKIQEKIYNKLV